MMPLPFSMEIRAARVKSEESNAATTLLHQLRANLQSLDIILRQHTTNESIQPTLPGEELLAEIITRWPELAGISGIELAETESYQARLHRKKLQHETILRHILPISTEEHSRAHDLAHLQEEQQRALAAPEWSDTTARLRKIGAERDALALQLATIQQKVALVKPIQIATKAYLQHIHVEHDGRADGGPEDQALVNAIANEALTSLQAILSVSQIQIGLIIDQTSSGPSTVEIIQALTNLLDAVNSQIGELEDQVNHHQSSYDLMTKALLDELG